MSHRTLLTSLCFVIGSFSPLAATHLDQTGFEIDRQDRIIPRKKTTTLAFLKRYLLEQAKRHPERFNIMPSSNNISALVAEDLPYGAFSSRISLEVESFHSPNLDSTSHLERSGLLTTPQSPKTQYSVSPLKFEETVSLLEQKIACLEKKENKLRIEKQSFLDILRENENILYSLQFSSPPKEPDTEPLQIKIRDQSEYITKELENARLRYNSVCNELAKAKEKAKSKKAKLDRASDGSPYIVSRLHSRLDTIIQRRSGPPSILKRSTPNAPTSTLRATPELKRVSFNKQVYYSPIQSVEPCTGEPAQSP